MSAGGHFNIHRALFGSDFKPTKRRPACRGYAWVWIIGLARWRKSGALLRGEFYLSVRLLADEMCWPKSVAERFLDELLRDGRLTVIERASSGTVSGTPRGRHFLVVKYEEFQAPQSRAGRRAGVERDNKKKEEGRRKENGVAVAPKSEGVDDVQQHKRAPKKKPAARKSRSEQRDYLADEIRKSEAGK